MALRYSKIFPHFMHRFDGSGSYADVVNLGNYSDVGRHGGVAHKGVIIARACDGIPVCKEVRRVRLEAIKLRDQHLLVRLGD